MKELLFGLLMWLNGHSDFNYDPNLGLPNVEQIGVQELVVRRFKGDPPKLSAEQLDQVKAGLLAIYDNDAKTVFVSERVDLDSQEGQAVLLHELVHFVQYELGHDRRAQCVNELERDAYFLQADYMREHGMRPGFDRFTVVVRSACMSGY